MSGNIPVALAEMSSDKSPIAPGGPIAPEAVIVMEGAAPNHGTNQGEPLPITEVEVRAMTAQNQRQTDENIKGIFGEGTGMYASLPEPINYREIDYILSGGYSDERLIDMLCAKGYQKLSKEQVGDLLKAACAYSQRPQKSELNAFFEKLRVAHKEVSSDGTSELASLGVTASIAAYFGCACWPCTAFISCCVGYYVAKERYEEIKRIAHVDYVKQRYIFAYYKAFGIASDHGMTEPTPSEISR